jgi:hypothetical protein
VGGSLIDIARKAGSTVVVQHMGCLEEEEEDSEIASRRDREIERERERVREREREREGEGERDHRKKCKKEIEFGSLLCGGS